ncbi:hypothetical protein A9310_23380 [Gordonia sp. UCD-TK1]|nr:hypothetical protein A9310_23380 [Gordonia sp. UCD-TK1]
MTLKVQEHVNDFLAAVAHGAGRYDAMRDAVLGLNSLGAKAQRGVPAALRLVETEYVAAVAAARGGEGAARAEFERARQGGAQVVVGDPAYRRLNTYSGDTFNPDGSWNAESPLARTLAELFGETDESPPVSRARFAAVPASDLAGQIPPMQWLIKGVWALNSFGPLGGEKKTLKSYNLLSMSVAVASGLPFYGEFEVASPGPVLYYAGEGGRDEHQRRLQAIARAYGVPLQDLPLHTVFDAGGLDEADFLGALHNHMDTIQPRLVVIDPLYAFHPTGVEAQNLYERGRMLSDFNAEVGNETSLVIADHFNKTGRAELDLDSIAQSGMGQWADSWMLQLHREPPDQDAGEFRLAMEFGSRRWGGRRWNVDWRLPSAEAMERGEVGDVSWSVERSKADKESARGQQVEDDIVRVLRDEPDYSLTVTALREKVGGNREKTKRAVERMLAEGRIVQDKRKWPEQRPDGTTKPVSRTRIGLPKGVRIVTETAE